MTAYSRPLALIDSLNPVAAELELAAALTAPGARLTLLDVLSDQGWTWNLLGRKAEEIQQKLREKKEPALAKVASELSTKSKVQVTGVVQPGRTGQTVIKQVQTGQHDVVFLRAKGPHSHRVGGIGDTAWELLRRCPCDVLLVGENVGQAIPKKILVALDAAAENTRHVALNKKIISAAARLAVKLNASLTVLHCWAIYGENLIKDYMSAAEFRDIEEGTRKFGEDGLQSLVAELTEKPSELSLKLIRGLPNAEIPTFANANHFDLVVMGTVARRGIAGALLGNTAEEVLPQLHMSILAIKPDDFPGAVS